MTNRLFLISSFYGIYHKKLSRYFRLNLEVISWIFYIRTWSVYCNILPYLSKTSLLPCFVVCFAQRFLDYFKFDVSDISFWDENDFGCENKYVQIIFKKLAILKIWSLEYFQTFLWAHVTEGRKTLKRIILIKNVTPSFGRNLNNAVFLGFNICGGDKRLTREQSKSEHIRKKNNSFFRKF